MEEIQVVKYLISRIESKLQQKEEYNEKIDRFMKEKDSDKPYWQLRTEIVGNAKEPSLEEMRDTLKLIRKITLDIDKKLKKNWN